MKKISHAHKLCLLTAVSILFTFQSGISFAAEDCIAKSTTNQYHSPGSLFDLLIKAKSGKCTKDAKERQKILIDGIIEIKESDEQAIPTVVKGFILDSSNKIYLGPKDSSKVSEIKIKIDEVIIDLKSTGNMIEGLTIHGGMGDCISISGKDNTVINNKFSGCGYYGISAYGDALEQLKTDYNLATQLLCSNTVLVTATVPFTNIDLNNNKKDDYKEFNDMIDGVSICSIWKSSGGKTVCKEGYKLDETNACSLCDEATNYYKDNAGNCVLCSGENKKLVDGQCICKDDTVEEWPVGSGLCISKCAEGETRNAEGACISDCPNQNEAMLDGACACKEGFGRYFYNGMTKESALAFPCVDCGDFKDTTTDRLYCLCGLDQHRSLSGSCVSTCPEN
ncbi:MAG: right-handed parallel beta-helix repeat-containing protein [Deltaproteobacteria bacterium]|nr:right-handed parallel beta-helix repeat-containing protein [Deltaproteobacteria bacterium]